MPVFLEQCRQCRRPLEVVRPVTARSTPHGWRAEALPDGSIQLSRTLWGRLAHSHVGPGGFIAGPPGATASLLVAGVVVMLIRFGIWGVWPHHSGGRALAMLLAAVVGLVLAGFARETWHLRRGEVRVNWGLFGIGKTEVHTGERLVLRWITEGVLLHHRHCWVLVVERLGKERVLCYGSALDAAYLYELGICISRATGWPIILPDSLMP